MRALARHATTASRRDVPAFLGGFLLPLVLFSGIAATVSGRGAGPLDSGMLELADRHYRVSVVAALSRALHISLGIGAVVAIAVVVVLAAKKRPLQAAFFALAVGGVFAFDGPLKDLFRRPEWVPAGYAQTSGYSFPSGHAMASAAMLAALVVTVSPRWRRLTLILGVPLLVAGGVLLVYSWWHYPSDVLGGWCIAVAWVTGLWLVLRRASTALAGRSSSARDPSRSPAL